MSNQISKGILSGDLEVYSYSNNSHISDDFTKYVAHYYKYKLLSNNNVELSFFTYREKIISFVISLELFTNMYKDIKMAKLLE